MSELVLRIDYTHQPKGPNTDLTIVREKNIGLGEVRRWHDHEIDAPTMLNETGHVEVISIHDMSGTAYFTNVNGWVTDLP